VLVPVLEQAVLEQAVLEVPQVLVRTMASLELPQPAHHRGMPTVWLHQWSKAPPVLQAAPKLAVQVWQRAQVALRVLEQELERMWAQEPEEQRVQVLVQVRRASLASTKAWLVLLLLLQVRVAPQVQAVLQVLLVRTMASPQVLQAQEVPQVQLATGLARPVSTNTRVCPCPAEVVRAGGAWW
jgi:hypothetical protein